jgi:hypothetical protein
MAADRAGELAQPLGRLGQVDPHFTAGEHAGLTRLGE